MVFISRCLLLIFSLQHKEKCSLALINAREHQRQSEIRALQLSEKLCQILDIEALIGLFFDEIQRDIPHDSVTYSNLKPSIVILLGKPARHRMKYSLAVNDQQLGDITIARSHPFTAEEASLMEILIDRLVYPLRNASMYQLAMMSAFRDPLTGIHNRASLEQSLPREISLAQRHKTPLTLLVIDVDHFKQINDIHGHLVGDSVLRNLIKVLTHSVRTTDLVFRYGGDEFVVALSNTDINGARDVTERIRESVERYQFSVGNIQLLVRASIGMTALNASDTLESAFRRADKALLLAKREGRNQVAKV